MENKDISLKLYVWEGVLTDYCSGIAFALARNVNDGIVSAMSAAIQSVSERAVEELSRGILTRILIEGEEGNIILSKAGNNAILCTLTKPGASLGMVFLNIQSVSKKIAELLD